MKDDGVKSYSSHELPFVSNVFNFSHSTAILYLVLPPIIILLLTALMNMLSVCLHSFRGLAAYDLILTITQFLSTLLIQLIIPLTGKFQKYLCREGGSTGVSVRACEPRIPVSSPDIRCRYYRRVAKDYPNCCHIVLRRNSQCYMHLRL